MKIIAEGALTCLFLSVLMFTETLVDSFLEWLTVERFLIGVGLLIAGGCFYASHRVGQKYNKGFIRNPPFNDEQ